MLVTFWENYKRRKNFASLKEASFSFLFDKAPEDEYVVVDTETTGLDPKRDEILSIGAVRIKGNRILASQTFEVFIKNSKEISSKSIQIHKIRPCDLEDAKEPEVAIREFLHFVGATPLVGYYLEFDVAMINKYIKPMLGITMPHKMIEVSEIYFEKTITLIPQGNIDLRFDTILKKCGIPNMGAHNAVNDAIMTAMIFLKLTKENNNVRNSDKTSF